jgi:hypothetical protein
LAFDGGASSIGRVKVLRSLTCVIVAVSATGCGSSSRGDANLADGASAEDARTTDDASGGSSDAPPEDAPSSNDAGSGAYDAYVACTVDENDAGTCNSIVPMPLLITAICSTAEPPQATGGAIVNGTYVLDGYVHYGYCPTTPDIAATTWSLCGDAWDVSQLTPRVPTNVEAGLLPPTVYDFRVTVTGATVDFFQSCATASEGMVTLGTRGYTATAHDLTFIYVDPLSASGVVTSHYTRQ